MSREPVVGCCHLLSADGSSCGCLGYTRLELIRWVRCASQSQDRPISFSPCSKGCSPCSKGCLSSIGRRCRIPSPPATGLPTSKTFGDRFVRIVLGSLATVCAKRVGIHEEHALTSLLLYSIGHHDGRQRMSSPKLLFRVVTEWMGNEVVHSTPLPPTDMKLWREVLFTLG